MSNSYFQFKQFRIDQEDCAMKVCTDSCILGAFAHRAKPERILDIGAGTGLLALMLAQRYSCPVDAVEIDELAAKRAGNNFRNSPWSDRVKIFYSSIQLFEKTAREKYDLIISNPPFFNNHLKSPKVDKNLALHNDSLEFEELAACVSGLMREDGFFFILLPPYESEVFEKTALGFGLLPGRQLYIFNSEGKGVFRVITTYSFQKAESRQDSLIIKNKDQSYTNAFENLLKDYYLIF